MPETTLEEMEKATATPETPKPLDLKGTKLEGIEGLPDALKGKSLEDVISLTARLQESLRTSEESRLAMKTALESGRPIEKKEEAVEEVQMTRDELNELFKEDPIKAIEYMQGHLVKTLDGHLEKRFRPLVDGNISNAERAARSKFATEFELFAKEIAEVAKQVDPSVLSTEKGWSDVVTYVRGMEGNFEKLVEAKTAKKTSAEARSEQALDAGFTPKTTTRPAAGGGGPGATGLDATQQEIARTLFPDLEPDAAYAEYKKWQ